MDTITITHQDVAPVINGNSELNESQAIAALLATRQIEFYNNKLWVDCSDIFVWGMGDEIELDVPTQLPSLMNYFLQDRYWGSVVWCCIQRKSRPQEPIEEKIRESGKIDFDAVIAEYGLRANYYDGPRIIQQNLHKELANKWWFAQGNTEITDPSEWYSTVWAKFVEENHDWRTVELEQQLDVLYNEWYTNNGYNEYVTQN